MCIRDSYQAEKSGKGESIDLAMYETLLAIGQYYLVDYLKMCIRDRSCTRS